MSMSDPTPETSLESAPLVEVTRTYSAFYPVLVGFLMLAVLHAVYVFSDLNERAQVKRARAELNPIAGQAQRVVKVIENLSHDLVALAGANDAEAAKIVADFNIKTNRPAAR